MQEEAIRSQSDAEDRAESILPWIQLTMAVGVGPLLCRQLVEHFGSPAKVLEAAPAQLRELPGLGPKLSRAIARVQRDDAEAELTRCRHHGFRILTPADGRYPKLLHHLFDPPTILYEWGSLLPEDELAVAIVGTRHATQYGLRQARRIAAALARAGVTIVSGLARGIDTAAHQAALEAGGRTIAVLGGGLLQLYPAENETLAKEIAQCGAVISELPTLTRPHRGTFPRRNRIVTGLCHGVVVVEAGERSGALISARLSAEQGRDVFALPGPVDQRTSLGCHQLIRDGAKLVMNAEDVLEELGPLIDSTINIHGHDVHRPAELMLNELERTVLDAVGWEITSIEEVVEQSELPVQRVLATLSVLEMRRMIRRLSGTSIIRT